MRLVVERLLTAIEQPIYGKQVYSTSVVSPVYLLSLTAVPASANCRVVVGRDWSSGPGHASRRIFNSKFDP